LSDHPSPVVIDPRQALLPRGAGLLRVDLGRIQETLLIPLYLRARESQRADAIVRDPVAVELIERLDYDFSQFASAWNIQLDVVVRAEITDERISEFLARHPRAVVVNLGAGLDARHARFARPGLRWFDLDLPDVAALRRQVLRDLPAGCTLDKSLLDPAWIDEVGRQPDEGILLVAEGVFGYLQGAELRTLFTRLADRLPGAELVFQSISPHFVRSSVRAVNRTRATLEWGIHTARDLETWEPRCKFVGEWCFLDRYRERWGYLSWLARIPVYGRRYRQVLKVSQVRFCAAG
jgi:O-methyltransferase involved in polyketide biosynthesis